MANEIHTLNIGNTSYTIQPRVLGPMTTYSTDAAQFTASGVVRYDTLLGNNPFGTSKSTDFNNAVLSISRHDTDKYTTQLGFSGRGIFARWFSNKTPDATTPWRRFIMDDGADALNIDTPDFVVENDVTRVSSSEGVIIQSELIRLSANNINIASQGTITIGDSSAEASPNVNIRGGFVSISGGDAANTVIMLGNNFARNYAQTITTFCDIIPGENDINIGNSDSKFSNIYSLTSYATNGFFQSSDERLKNFGDNIKVDFDALSKLRKAYFTWNDNPDTTHIGVSAQEVQEIYPEIVTETDGQLSVDYAKLSVVALAAVDELYKKNVELETRLDKIEAVLLK